MIIELTNAQTSPKNTHILDSVLIKSKEDMRVYIRALRTQCPPDMAVCQRDLESMVREWRAHNFFYMIHVFRSRTKDVDLELKQSWPREVFCWVVNFFYFW